MEQLIRIAVPASVTASGISWLEQLNPWLEAGAYLSTIIMGIVYIIYTINKMRRN